MSYTKQDFVNGQTLKAEHLNHMEDGIETANITGADGIIKQEHLPDGYPYKTVEEGYILEECQPIDSGEGMFFLTDFINEKLKAGKEYTVKWNGVDYKTTAIFVEGVGFGLGNAGVLMEDESLMTEEPFAIMAPLPESEMAALGFGVVVIPVDGSTSVTLSIYGDVPVYHPISERYLPAPTVKINVEVNATWDIISCDKKYADVHEKVLAGSDAILYLSDRNNSILLIGRLADITETSMSFVLYLATIVGAYVFNSDETWTRGEV